MPARVKLQSNWSARGSVEVVLASCSIESGLTAAVDEAKVIKTTHIYTIIAMMLLIVLGSSSLSSCNCFCGERVFKLYSSATITFAHNWISFRLA
jgi:hypothetical protein